MYCSHFCKMPGKMSNDHDYLYALCIHRLMLLASIILCIYIYIYRSEELLADANVGQKASTLENPCTLWVDKYAPRQYTDLLSDDVSKF